MKARTLLSEPERAFTIESLTQGVVSILFYPGVHSSLENRRQKGPGTAQTDDFAHL